MFGRMRPTSIRIAVIGLPTLTVAAVMAGYELLKELIVPGLAPWASHAMTIAVTTTLAATATLLAGRDLKRAALQVGRTEESPRNAAARPRGAHVSPDTSLERGALGLAMRLQLVLALVTFTVVLVAGLGYAGLSLFEHRLIALYEDRVVPLRELKSVSDRHAIDIVDAVHKVAAGRFTPEKGRDVLTAALADVDEEWRRYAATPSAAKHPELLAESAALLARARAAAETARGFMIRGDLPALEAFRTGEMYTEIDPLTMHLGQLVETQLRETDALVRVAQHDLRKAREGTTTALVLAGALAMAIGVQFSRRLGSSLRTIEPVVRAAASGDLSRRVGLTGADELARMAGDIDRMITNLEESRRIVDAHATALEKSEREAHKANAAKSVFLSSMSHELRSPLNVILGYAQLLLRKRSRSGEETQELQRIMRAGNHLLGLIDDVLSISKIEAGALTLRPRVFATSELFRNVEDILAPSARAKGLEFAITLTPQVPSHLHADDRKVAQVLVNLLGNAIKFTKDGHVRARVDYAEEKLFGTVSDTGPGISVEEQESLFQAFHQGAAGSASVEGTGLGLYISQSLARLMGGEIRVRSTLGEGTEFSFSVDAPVAASPSTEVREYASARLPAGRPIAPMLVVDDRGENRDVLARLLRSLGAEVVEASTGEEALALLAEGTFSTVWMDLRMPGMSGVEVLARLRSRESEQRRPRTRAVAMTASVIEFDREAAVAAGFDDLVTKPFLAETICGVVESVLGITLETHATAPRPPATFAALATALPASFATAAPAPDGARVLVVDDSEVNAELASEVLRGAGYAVDVARDGQGALAEVARRSYDVVLLDGRMPGMDGYETSRRIRRLEREGKIHAERPLAIIALTASAGSTDRDQAIHAGMDDYVAKPFEASALLQVVAAHLRGVRHVDLSRARARLGGDEAILGRAIQRFLALAPETWSLIRVGVTARDAAKITFAVHRLRGQAATFDATRLVEAVEAITKAAEDARWTAADERVAHAESELDAVMHELRADAARRARDSDV